MRTEQVEEGQVDVYDFGVVLVVGHCRHPAPEARVVLLAHVVYEQSLEAPLGVEHADYGLRFEYLAADQSPHVRLPADPVLGKLTQLFQGPQLGFH